MKVLDKGHLELVASCAQDLDVVNAAKVSFNATVNEMDAHCEGLIRYLMENHHGTPFEHNYFKFRVKAPLFVFREWHRHRVGHSYNEWSARYSKLEPEFYVPGYDEVVSQVGKPGSYSFETVDEELGDQFSQEVEYRSRNAYKFYETWLERGISKQQARLLLPVNIYSEMIWSCNARSLMHFLSQRAAKDAQAEIRAYAEAAESYFSEIMPVTYREFVNCGRTAP